MINSDLDSGNAAGGRMDADNLFTFRCSPGVPCFTQCCQDVTIVLTPYDVLRLKNRLGISSEDFIDRYTIVIPKAERLIPLVILRMNADDKKCPFVTEEGCTVYEDRPWPCRMYPLDMNDDGTFRIITDASRCKGLNEQNQRVISDWLIEQGVPAYDEMNNLFSQITTPLQAQEFDIDNPQISKMIFMSLYNADAFRNFVFQSSFLQKFEIDTSRLEKIKRKDIDLLKLAYDWIKFGIFGQKVLDVKQKAPERAASPSGE